MSIKGKKKEIPLWYRTEGTSSAFGSPGPLAAPNLQGIILSRYTTAVILQHATAGSRIVTPYSPLIPFSYLHTTVREQSAITWDATGTMIIRDSFRTYIRSIARRALNRFAAKYGVDDPRLLAEITDSSVALTAIKVEVFKDLPVIRFLSEHFVETPEQAKYEVHNWVQEEATRDRPLIFTLARRDYGEAGASYSREAMAARILMPGTGPQRFAMRTYEGLLDYGTLLYCPFPSTQGTPLLPAMMAVMTPTDYMYQQYHYFLYGTIDPSAITFLVDRELDNPRFEINGLREFYKRQIEPALLQQGYTLWKVPRSYIEENCFTRMAPAISRNIFAFRQSCERQIEQFYNTLGNRYTGPQEPVRSLAEIEAERLLAETEARERELQAQRQSEEEEASLQEAMNLMSQRLQGGEAPLSDIEVSEDGEEAYVDSDEWEEEGEEEEEEEEEEQPVIEPVTGTSFSQDQWGTLYYNDETIVELQADFDLFHDQLRRHREAERRLGQRRGERSARPQGMDTAPIAAASPPDRTEDDWMRAAEALASEL